VNAPRDYETAARELGVSQAWLEEYTPSIPLPHSKFAVDEDGRPSRRGRGAVRFYDEDIAAIRQMFSVRPSTVEKNRAAGPVTRRRAS
jgi:hypothetical protein